VVNTEFGSLAYFIAAENIAQPPFQALLNSVGAAPDTAGDLINGLRKELEVIEHISGKADLIDATGNFDQRLWRQTVTNITVQ
jgi:hypothetical protein